MRNVDSLIVPVVFIAALGGVLAVTVSWVRHPVQPIGLRVVMGPPTIVLPRHLYGLRFTPRNPLSGHILTRLVAAQRRCVDVTITDVSLTYLDQVKACRLKDGSYTVPYRFPRADDYVIFVEMHPVGGLAHAARETLSLDPCLSGATPPARRACRPHPAQLRGKEVMRSHMVDGLEIVLGAPARAVQTQQTVAATFLILRTGRAVRDLQALDGLPGRALAISMDTHYLVHLDPDPGQVAHGRVADGAVTFAGWFDYPGIYKVFGTFRYRRHPIRTSFVIDVNPKPTPTPSD